MQRVPQIPHLQRLLNSRRNNILITGLPHDNVTADEDRFHSISVNDQRLSNDISTILPITCKRVGKISTKPQPLSVAFNDAHYRDRTLSNAKLLRLSASASIKDSVHISPDLTELERKEQLTLHQEQRAKSS